MKFFINKLFLGEGDAISHLQFEKFSKGTFTDRAAAKIKLSKGIYSIATTNEYGNEFVRLLAEMLENKKTKITGVIVSTRNLKELPEFKPLLGSAKVKQFAGVKQFLIDQEMTGKDILALIDNSPRAFFGLSFSVGDTSLTIKPKAPKSGKPGKVGEDGPKIDFCKLKTTNKSIVSSICFETQEFKEVTLNHTFVIDSIDVPTDEKDPVRMRERAIRAGKIIRTVTIDGTKKETEFKFSN